MEAQVNRALDIMKHHDWYWRMADYGYEANYNSAKASMRRFVKAVSEVSDIVVREALKNLWMLNFDEARANVNGNTIEGLEDKRTELMNIIAA